MFFFKSRSPNCLPAWLRILGAVSLGVCVLYVSTVRLSGDDFWLQAKIGEIITNRHAIPNTLLFPFTEVSTDVFNAHEWLISIAFHFSLRYFGEDGVPFLIGGLGLILCFLASRLTYIRSNSHFSLALLGGYLGILGENYRHVLRPELPSLLLFLLLWNFIENFKTKQSLWLAALSSITMLVWVNSHGSFILGPILVTLYIIGSYLDDLRGSKFQSWKINPLVLRLLGLLVIVSLACLANPYGLGMIRFVLSFGMEDSIRAHLTEWLPTFDPRLHEIRGFWVGVAIWIFSAFLLLTAAKRASFVDWLIFITFSYLSYRAIRFPVYLGFVAAYLLPLHVSNNVHTNRHERVLSYIVICLSVLSLGAAIFWGNLSASRPYTTNDVTKFSPSLIRALENPALKGNILNNMEYGAELIYRTYPRLRPSIDCRFDSYGVDYTLFNETLFKNDVLLREFVSRYGVAYLMMSVGRFREFQNISSWKDGGWRLYFADSKAVILQRSDIYLPSLN